MNAKKVLSDTNNCELIKGYELNKKAPEVMNTSEAKSVCATMSG